VAPHKSLVLLFVLSSCGHASSSDEPNSHSERTFSVCRDRTFTPAPREEWRHTRTQFVVAAGSPNHAAQDVIAKPEMRPSLVGKFAYGPASIDLEDENVRVFLDRCNGWQDLGAVATDSDGRILMSVPDALGPGVYEARLQVLGDGSTTLSYLWVLPARTRLTLTDIDGTLTASDSELFAQILDGSHVPVAYPGAADLTLAHNTKRWLVVYLTGRPYWLTGHTRDWLQNLGFSSGPLHVTDSTAEALPTESGVGAFKLAWIQGLLAAGYLIDFAYGNAPTDISAYLGAGIPAEDVWIIGDNAGHTGTNSAVGGWQDRVRDVQALSAVEQPFE
jgi:phosphatidate phosphatase PAH1